MDEKSAPGTATCCQPVVRPSDDEKRDYSGSSTNSATYHPEHAAGVTADLALLEGDRIDLAKVDPKELRRVLWKIDLAM